MSVTNRSMVFAMPRKCVERGCKNQAVIGMYRCKGHLAPPPRAVSRRKAAKQTPDKETRNFVYFLRSENGLIKIGRTSGHPEKRMAEIQGMSPSKLELLAAFPCHPRMEKLLHKMFVHRRAHGEWFNSCDKLEGLIRAVKENDRPMMEMYLARKDRDYGGEYCVIDAPPEFAASHIERDVEKTYYSELDKR